MPKFIKATDALHVLSEYYNYRTVTDNYRLAIAISRVPPADVVEVKHGYWEGKEVIHAEEAKTAIEEWQSCRCSVCGRYDTRLYMYYFDKPNFCSFCGAKMDGEGTEDE